jgi:hypothetical protein
MKFRRGQSVDKAISIDTGNRCTVTDSHIVIGLKQVSEGEGGQIFELSGGYIVCSLV